jgi:hypothetical protein
MVTYIRDNPELAYLGVNHPLKVNLGKMKERGYLAIREPEQGEPIRILQTWECPVCGTGPHWAEIIISDDRIQSITAVPLDRETFEHAHFIHYDAKGVAASLSGRAYGDLDDDEAVPILRRVL